MADSSSTRPNLVQDSSSPTIGDTQSKTGFPHESDSSTRPRPKPGRGRVRSGNLVQHSSQHFTASTCRKCGAITITGTIHGLPHHLEPTTLNDHTEYAALAEHVPTYDLWPDRTARRRHLEEIRHPDRVPRHARHTCGTTYGTHARPTPPATNPGDPNGPPPF